MQTSGATVRVCKRKKPRTWPRTLRTIAITVAATLSAVFIGLAVLGTVMPGTAAQPPAKQTIVKFSG